MLLTDPLLRLRCQLDVLPLAQLDEQDGIVVGARDPALVLGKGGDEVVGGDLALPPSQRTSSVNVAVQFGQNAAQLQSRLN